MRDNMACDMQNKCHKHALSGVKHLILVHMYGSQQTVQPRQKADLLPRNYQSIQVSRVDDVAILAFRGIVDIMKGSDLTPAR